MIKISPKNILTIFLFIVPFFWLTKLSKWFLVLVGLLGGVGGKMISGCQAESNDWCGFGPAMVLMFVGVIFAVLIPYILLAIVYLLCNEKETKKRKIVILAALLLWHVTLFVVGRS